MNNKKVKKTGKTGKIGQKAQIQMGESIAVIVIITIMIFFGLTFYSRVKYLEIEQDTEQFNQFDAVKLANAVSNMPELLCSQQKVIDINCVDKYKIIALQDSVGEGAGSKAFFYYRSLLGNSRITVEQLYPKKRNYTVYDNNFTAAQDTKAILIPINIYDGINDTKAFGVLRVEAYS
ncbi:MAG: hypothetical protein ABIE94_04945 [archaeon]